jgi:hypothetical protein
MIRAPSSRISDVWNYSSSLINEARLGFTDQLNFFLPQTAGLGYPAMLGYQLVKADPSPELRAGQRYYRLRQWSSVAVYL